MKLSLLPVLALLLASCAGERGTIVTGTAQQWKAGEFIQFTPSVPVDIGRRPKTLSVLTVPNLQPAGGGAEVNLAAK